MGVEKEKNEKSYKWKVSILTLKMLGPLLFVYKGCLSMFFVLQILFCNSKKIPKNIFHKKCLLNVNLKNVVKQKICTREYTGRRQNFNQRKSKLKVLHSYRKKSLNHTSETPKKSFFFQFRSLRSVSTLSLYLLQT